MPGLSPGLPPRLRQTRSDRPDGRLCLHLLSVFSNHRLGVQQEREAGPQHAAADHRGQTEGKDAGEYSVPSPPSSSQEPLPHQCKSPPSPNSPSLY